MHKRYGFNITELIVVVAVVGILAAIVTVAYIGVTNAARENTLKDTVVSVGEKLEAEAAVNKGVFPVSLSSIGVSDSVDTTFQYTADPYCLTVTKYDMSYSIGTGRALSKSTCIGHNLMVWDKSQASATNPVPGQTLDESVYRVNSPSVRIGPGNSGKNFRIGEIAVQAGQTYRVTLYIKTDSNWDGTSSNSKIRFGRVAGNILLKACGYNGVKTAWTSVSCEYTTVADDVASGIKISVGNDGTVGNIWLDDISVARMN